MSETLKEVLIRRDRVSASEADKLIQEARAQLFEYLTDEDFSSADEICMEMFGLEEDYMHELIG
jgi:hypothetical protein